MVLEKTETETETAKTATTTETTNGELRGQALNGRMIKLMARIAEHGYLTIREVGLIYANQTYAYKVLGTLKDMRLIGQFKTTLKPRKAYYLKPKGYRTLANYGALRLQRRFLPQHFKPFIFTHRLASARAGLILETHPLIRDFLPESLLWERRKNDREKVCDGEFFYLVPGEKRPLRVGLEVELSLKNRERLVNSFRDLLERRDLDQVWWLCGDKAILRTLTQLVDYLPWVDPQRHRFALWAEFEEAGGKFKLSDCKGVARPIDVPARPEPEPPRPPDVPLVVVPKDWPPRLSMYSPKPVSRIEETKLRFWRTWRSSKRPWHWYAGWAFLVAAIVASLFVGIPIIREKGFLFDPVAPEETVK